jgi:glycosyltransferase involved in cell wall biosynthesis
VHGANKWALIANARLLTLPSMSENFGNVVPEAMAMGCPVVVTRGVGASEVVEAAQAGLVCDADDRALREALLRIWSDDALREQMAERGRAFVDAQLRWTRVAARMADTYEALRRECAP